MMLMAVLLLLLIKIKMMMLKKKIVMVKTLLSSHNSYYYYYIGLSIQASIHAMTLLLRYLVLFSNDGVVKDSIALLSAIALIIVKLYSGKLPC